MSTTLFAVTAETLARLEAKPDSISDFESKQKFDTYLWQSLPYFLTHDEESEDDDEDDDDEDDDDEDDDDEDDEEDGDEDGDEDDDADEEEDEEDDGPAHPLDAILIGDRSIKCRRLENGAFHTISPARVAELSTLLAAVKPAEIKRRVLAADLEEALDGELFEELEQLDLTEPDEVATQVVQDLKSLVKFYAAAAKSGLAIVLYTT